MDRSDSFLLDQSLDKNNNFSVIGVDYLKRLYPRQNISIPETFVYTHPGTGYSYTVLNAEHDGKPIVVTVNRENNKTGRFNQIQDDYVDYIRNLPKPYRKMSSILRNKIKSEYNGSLPSRLELDGGSDRFFDVIIFLNSTRELVSMAMYISSISPEFPDVYDDGETRFISTSLSLTDIHKLSDQKNYGYVKNIWLNRKFGSSLDFSVSPSGVNGYYVHDLGYKGEGINVTIIDSGIDNTHPALDDAVIKVKDFDSWYCDIVGNCGEDAIGHGTFVAGIVASDNETYTGMAPDVNLFNAKVSGLDGEEDQVIDAIKYFKVRGTDIFQLSYNLADNYATPINGTWQLSRLIDETIYGYGDETYGQLIVVSAGNYLYATNPDTRILPPADSFNSISVGNAYYDSDLNEWLVYWTSGHGETSDGRRKVDVCAPGTDITSAYDKWEGPTLDFVEKAPGTSFAAPHVSGLAALLYEYAKGDNYYMYHTSLAIKAAILNSATKISNYSGSSWSHDEDDPLDYFSGAGMINAKEAFDLFTNQTRLVKTAITDYDGDHTYYVNATQGTNLTITLVWNRHETDYEVEENFALLNNLNLYVYNSSGNYVVRSISAVDNVEHIHWNVTSTGEYSIVIKAENFYTDNSEPYALAITYDASGILKRNFKKNLVNGWNLISLPVDLDG